MFWRVVRQAIEGLSSFLVWFYSKISGGKDVLVKQLFTLKEVLAVETAETKHMIETYNRYIRGEVDRDEMRKANSQFRDLLKTLGLGVLVVLPFAPITLPLLVKVSEKLGVDLFPSSVRDLQRNSHKADNDEDVT